MWTAHSAYIQRHSVHEDQLIAILCDNSYVNNDQLYSPPVVDVQ